MSRYTVATRREGAETAYYLADAHFGAEAVVYPAFGNNCVAFRTSPQASGGQAGDVVELLVPPDDVTALRDHPTRGGLPILFPFPNRVRAGTYAFEGRTFHMARLLATGRDRQAGQAIHGLVGDQPWRAEEATADEESASLRCSLRMDATPEIAEQYPFPSTITVTYAVVDGALQMTTEVANTGEADMPMGFGIHPWFPPALRAGLSLPADLSRISQEERARAQVRVPAAAVWELEQYMPTGAIMQVDASPEEFDLRAWRPLDGLQFDNVFTQVDQAADGSSEAGVRDPDTGLELYVRADAHFREWVLYAPLDRRVVALEPYTCTTDAVNLQPRGIDAGLIVLRPGHSWIGRIAIGLRRFA